MAIWRGTVYNRLFEPALCLHRHFCPVFGSSDCGADRRAGRRADCGADCGADSRADGGADSRAAGGADGRADRGAGRGGGRGGGRARRGEDARAEITVGFEVAAEGGEHGLTLQSGSQVEHITVKIPAGIEDGKTIRLAGQGNPGVGGGPAGDLLVTVHIAPHPWFRREGLNLLVDVPVTMTEAALGGKIDVPTLSEGEFLLSIPPGTSSGRRLRLKGKGVRNARTGERGDLFAVVRVAIPVELDEESKMLLRRLAELHPENPRQGIWGTGSH